MVKLTSLYFNTFRNVFKLPDKNLLRWFPGHMGKGMMNMKKNLKSIDCIIEVHDARIPFTGRNKNFKYTICGRHPHILVLNKKDLVDTCKINKIKQLLESDGITNIVFTNCKDHMDKGLKSLVPLAENLIVNSDRFNRTEKKDYCIMVIGVPNVGKSSLINAMRNRFLKKASAAPVGAIAGITRSVMSKIKICEDPLIYILDTPGILTPTVPSIESGMKLALCATMQDHLVGPVQIADYLLFWLNKHNIFNYVEYCGIEQPSDDIFEVLLLLSRKLNKTKMQRDFSGYGYKVIPDIEFAANTLIKAFRIGDFGKIILDEDLLINETS